MFDIHAGENMIEYCKSEIEKAPEKWRGKFDGSPPQRLAGVLGECVLEALWSMDWHKNLLDFDGGFDLVINGVKVDVKTMLRGGPVRPGYVSNVSALQVKYDCDVYILCSYNTLDDVVTVCGWVRKDVFLQEAEYYPKGSIRLRSNGTEMKVWSEMYEIDNSKLNDVNSSDALYKQIASLGR